MTIEEVEASVAAIGASLDGRGLTRQQLGAEVGKVDGLRAEELMASGWGTLLKPVAMEGGLVFGPEPGPERRVRQPRRLGRPVEPMPTEDAMRGRPSLAAVYGPGSHGDLARWWGRARARAKMLEGLGDELVEVSVEGRPGFALAEDASP